MKKVKNADPSGYELLSNDEHTFKPLYFCGKWFTDTMTQCCTAVIVLPTGVANENSDSCNLHIADNGWTLVLTVKWPTMPQDMDQLHACFNREEKMKSNFISRSMALERSIASMKERASTCLTSVARIPLDLQVEDKIESVECVGDKEGTRILYVNMKAPESSYNGVTTKKFKISY